MSAPATFYLYSINERCGEKGCTALATTVGVGVLWGKQRCDVYMFCTAHAAAVRNRILKQNATPL